MGRRAVSPDRANQRDGGDVTEKNEDIDEIDPAAELRFGVSIQIWHPTIDPAVLTEAFGRAPFRCWQMGLPRTTMRGDPLPGRWPQSYWVARRRVERRRDFLVELLQELTALEERSALVTRLLQEGGDIQIKVSLPGDRNIGDVLSADAMRRMGALGVNLDIEVFPDMD